MTFVAELLKALIADPQLLIERLTGVIAGLTALAVFQ